MALSVKKDCQEYKMELKSEVDQIQAILKQKGGHEFTTEELTRVFEYPFYHDEDNQTKIKYPDWKKTFRYNPY